MTNSDNDFELTYEISIAISEVYGLPPYGCMNDLISSVSLPCDQLN